MLPNDRIALEGLLIEMRRIHGELYERHAGVCVLHLEAAIAALESQLIRNGVPIERFDMQSRSASND